MLKPLPNTPRARNTDKPRRRKPRVSSEAPRSPTKGNREVPDRESGKKGAAERGRTALREANDKKIVLMRKHGFVFDRFECGGDIEIEGSGRRVTKRSDDKPDYATVAGSITFKEGSHYWEVKIIKGECIRFGVAQMPILLNKWFGAPELKNPVWFVQYDGYYRVNNGKGTVETVGQMEGFLEGDIIGIKLDLTAGTMRFTVNGEEEESMITGIEGPVRPVFNLDDAGDSLELKKIVLHLGNVDAEYYD